MSILQPRDEEAVRKEFERIAGPVKLVVFSQELVAQDLCRRFEKAAGILLSTQARHSPDQRRSARLAKRAAQ